MLEVLGKKKKKKTGCYKGCLLEAKAVSLAADRELTASFHGVFVTCIPDRQDLEPGAFTLLSCPSVERGLEVATNYVAGVGLSCCRMLLP